MPRKTFDLYHAKSNMKRRAHWADYIEIDHQPFRDIFIILHNDDPESHMHQMNVLLIKHTCTAIELGFSHLARMHSCFENDPGMPDKIINYLHRVAENGSTIAQDMIEIYKNWLEKNDD